MQKEFFRIALKNIGRHWKKSIVTSGTLALSYAGILLLGGYMVRMEKYLTTQGIYLNHVGHVALYKKEGLSKHLIAPKQYSFSPNEQKFILQELSGREEVERIAPFFHGQGIITNGCQNFPFLAWASNPEDERYLRNHPLVKERIPLLTGTSKGHGFWDSMNLVNGIVVTKRLAKLLNKPVTFNDPNELLELQDTFIENCHDDKTVKLISAHSGVQLIGTGLESGLALSDANIVGHYTTGFAFSEDNSILLPLPLARTFYGSDHITSFGIFLKDTSHTSSFMEWLKKKSQDWEVKTDLYDYKDPRVSPFYVGAMRFVYIMNLFFFIIVCGVVVLGLVNTIQIAIIERKTEIGTLLSIGYKKSQVRNIFEAESLLLGFFGLLSGMVLATGAVTLINSLGIQFDIVGNAEKLFLVLELNLLLCLGLIVFFLGLVSITTSLVCKRYLKVSLVRLLERRD